MLYNKNKTAFELIECHFNIEPGTVAIYRFISPEELTDEEPIKLLAVNLDTPETGQVDVITTQPTINTPFTTMMAFVTQDEMLRIESGEIELPEGWDLSTARKHPRPLKRRSRK